MQEFFGWLMREVILGLYWSYGAPWIKRLPKPVQMGCSIIGSAIIVLFVGVVLFAAIVKWTS